MASQRKTPPQDEPVSSTAEARFLDSLPEDVITIDRRRGTDRRKGEESCAGSEKAEKPKLERRAKVARRRQIDPTTCERDYTDEEIEFMNAIDEYKRTSGRMFPTCSEVLEVLRNLGYQKVKTPLEEEPATPESDASAESNAALVENTATPTEDTAAVPETVPAPTMTEAWGQHGSVGASSAPVPCS